MKIFKNDFFRVAVATVILLMIPLVAMQFSEDVEWNSTDFIVAGVLIFLSGSALVTILKKVKDKNRRYIYICLLAVAFFYVWAELAVGIFTNLGS